MPERLTSRQCRCAIECEVPTAGFCIDNLFVPHPACARCGQAGAHCELMFCFSTCVITKLCSPKKTAAGYCRCEPWCTGRHQMGGAQRRRCLLPGQHLRTRLATAPYRAAGGVLSARRGGRPFACAPSRPRAGASCGNKRQVKSPACPCRAGAPEALLFPAHSQCYSPACPTLAGAWRHVSGMSDR